MKRKIKIAFWIGLPLLAGVFIYNKWGNWFGNEPEVTYQASTLPDRILMSLSDNTYDSRDVTWRGDTLTNNGKLELTRDSVSGDTVRFQAIAKIVKTPGGAATYYCVKMNRLKPSVHYKYRVANGNNWSEWINFKLAENSTDNYSFIYIGDIQDSINGVSGDLFHRAYNNQQNAAFIMFIGDMIERPLDKYWGQWFKSGGDLYKSIPLIATPGNHEYYKGVIQALDERWMSQFSFPQNGPPDFLGRVCYWDYQNTRFISLDTNGIQTVPSALAQRSWLKKVLEETHQRWIVIMMHHPMYSTSRGRDYFYLRWLFKSLIDQYNVDLVLAGHDHAYGRSVHIPGSGSNDKQGAAYVVSHASPKLYDIGFSPKMDKLATNTQMYQLLDVNNDSIRFRAYTVDGTYFDGFTMIKDKNGNRKISVSAPPNEDRFLRPTASFIRNNSKKEIEKYNSTMLEWENSRIK